ncbi:hypothetical protein [Mucilaginibacter polytrichastri]|uniref:Cbb3-type cytochrome oxidase component FixQ n=1 Tax=Mucilaginibacter polytrichastri TaxID=1302689 RepID=A0A1Q6A0I1_9SPHI|nr:hypothetical protein [Mucilaginibacter polytrichastri]OKS87525.1 hypothetical protein RG47T_2986 [Mucilaginibacter polytrichastri]SFS91708.1 hypothetical protein SAMN04487890_106120 [Mucilaginibacter polytrichastri]
MFKQFTENIHGNEGYLLSSLAIFLLFFIVVAVWLLLIKKQHVVYMSDMPLHDSIAENQENLQP